METKRLFIAIVIDDVLGGAIEKRTNLLDPALWRVADRSDLHVTVVFLGDVYTGVIPDVKTIVENIALRTRQFKLNGGRTRIMRPDEPTMLWLRYERDPWFERLVEDAESCFHRIGTWERQRDRKRRKTSGDRYPIPHMTLARIKGGGMLDSLLPPIEADKSLESLPVRKLALFATIHDKKTGSSHYEKLAEWDLEQ